MKSTVTTSGAGPAIRGPDADDVVVIADAGDSAFLYVWRFPQRPAVGSRFMLNGVTWEIVHYRHHADAWVAEPVAH